MNILMVILLAVFGITILVVWGIFVLFTHKKTKHIMSLDTEIDSHVDLTPPGKKLDDLKSSLDEVKIKIKK